MRDLSKVPLTDAQKKLIQDKNSVILDPDFLDGAITGVTDEGRICYSYEKLVHAYEEDLGGHEEALEWVDYNTIRALDYMPDPKPLVE